jgi:hypothetical protein
MIGPPFPFPPKHHHLADISKLIVLAMICLASFCFWLVVEEVYDLIKWIAKERKYGSKKY